MANTKRNEQTTVDENIEQAENMKGNADQDTFEAQRNVADNKERFWIVKVANNPEYCGVGAGGTQFARGEATVRSERMALWFKEHKGYTVTEQQ